MSDLAISGNDSTLDPRGPDSSAFLFWFENPLQTYGYDAQYNNITKHILF